MGLRHCILFTCFTAFPITIDAQAQNSLIPPNAPVPTSTAPAATTSSVTVPHYVPPTSQDRMKWLLNSTLGPASLTGGAISAGWGTLNDKPSEYDTHWEGFGERFGMRMTGIATSNAMEASLGALWGEDPRYFRAEGQSLKDRLVHVMRMTFLAKDSNGDYMPAYARYTAIAGSNFLSNTWRPDSDATTSRATLRIGFGFMSRLTGNVWDEFWPDVRDSIFHHAH